MRKLKLTVQKTLNDERRASGESSDSSFLKDFEYLAISMCVCIKIHKFIDNNHYYLIILRVCRLYVTYW